MISPTKCIYSTIILLLSYILWYFINCPINLIKQVIIIDAGSTGTRLHLFNIGSDDSSMSYWKIENETVYYVSPGFIAHAQNISKIKIDIEKLINQVDENLLKGYEIPIYLGATGGLRLTDQKISNLMLQEAKNRLMEYKQFKLINNGAELLSGETEGLWGLDGLLYLLENHYTNEMNLDKIGTIDLGGASAQITLKNWEVGDVLTQSFLGLGLKEARLNILQTASIHKLFVPADINLTNELILHSTCLPTQYRGNWCHHGINYTLIGPKNKLNQFKACLFGAKSYISKFMIDINQVNKSTLVHNTLKTNYNDVTPINLFLFGYLYDRVEQFGVIKTTSSQFTTLTISQYRNIAELACSHNNSSPFDCVDLVFQYVLLKDALLLSNDVKLFVVKEIDGIRLGWTVGVLIEILKNQTVS